MNKNILFQPLTLKNGFTFKNRFVKPAMSEIMGDKAHLGVDLIDISGGNYKTPWSKVVIKMAPSS